MSDKQEENQIQTAIRVPESVLKRFDKLAEQMSVPGTQITRADVHRQAVYRGLAELEKENKKR
jgi:predicted DNA-binding protein